VQESARIASALRRITAEFYARGWTDGLPIVPPTPEGVQEMIAASGRAGDDLIAEIPPNLGKATVEKIAVNALMAGCLPEYMPVVIAAVTALADERVGIQAIQGTTDVHAPLLIVNGPVAKQLDINSGPNCFGQGWQANATIGRAIRLLLLNLGGGAPGKLDKSTFGHPGKYTYCVAENEAASPWEPLHVERGLQASDSAVTIFPCEAPHQISDHYNTSASGIMRTICDAIATVGTTPLYRAGEALLVISPEHASVFKQDGWRKQDVKLRVFEAARVPIGRMKRQGDWDATIARVTPRWVDLDDPESLMPVIRRPDDLIVIVAGARAGRFSLFMPGWGVPTGSATVKIEA
jgi:hypothetical protein